jgi:hypothetical protein
MNEATERDRRERYRRITEALDFPEHREPMLSDGRVLLGLSARPSRGPTSYAWVAVGTPRISPIMVREVAVPHGDPDRSRIRDAKVKPSVLYRAAKEARSIPIPVVLPHVEPAGLDGATFWVRIDFGSAATVVSFWGYGPKEWRDFTAWARRTMRLLHEQVAPDEPLEPALEI